MKPPSPLLGFNNNVRHKGRVFHIQTEDSGVRHPHIITHLFADGGRILKTAKTSYAEFIDAPNMSDLVKQMMQDQHKTMLMALRDGQFDHLVDEVLTRGGAPQARVSNRTAPSVAAVTPPVEPASPSQLEPAPASPPAQALPEAPSPSPPPLPDAQPSPLPPLALPDLLPSIEAAPQVQPAQRFQSAPPSPVRPTPASPARPAPMAAPPPLPLAARQSLQTAPTSLAVKVPAPPPGGAPMNESAPPAPPAQQRSSISGPSGGVVYRPTPVRLSSARPRLDIDPGAIHRAASAQAQAGGTLSSIESGPGIDLDTLERAAAETETPFFQQIRDLPPPPAAVLGARSSAGAYSSVSAPAQPPPVSTRGRYAASRPSSIFAAVRPQEGASIFGEDLISEKSLDEVILSYLAEDLDGPGEKK